MHQYKCSARCRPLTKDEVECILFLELAFDNPIDEVVHALCNCYAHLFGPEGFSQQVAKLGHQLVCYNDTGCRSNLRILKCGAVHYPVLLHFLNDVYSVLREYSNVKVIDKALGTGDCTKLMSLTKTNEYCDLLSNDVETSYETSQSGSSLTNLTKLRQPNLESQLMIEYAGTKSRLEKMIEDFAEHVCMSVFAREKMFLALSYLKLLSSEVWLRLLAYVICTNPEASSEQLYICNYCKPRIRSNELPSRCVLNGLQTVPVPPELNKLDALSAQLIQRAK